MQGSSLQKSFIVPLPGIEFCSGGGEWAGGLSKNV